MSIEDVLEVRQQPKNLHAAIDWLIAQSRPHTLKQIEEAAQRFSLSPLNEEILLKYFHQHLS